MGYALAYSACFGCKEWFYYNPVHVPSVWIDPETGLSPDLGGDPARAEREPVCPRCVALANASRQRSGRELIVVHPQAYEPADEREL
jgi:hypothetical protein